MVLDASLLNTQHYKVRIKGKVEQSRKGVAPSPTPWCSSYRKGSLRVTLDYGRQLYSLSITSATRNLDRTTENNTRKFTTVCQPYVKGLTKKILKICSSYAIRTIFRSVSENIFSESNPQQKTTWPRIVHISSHVAVIPPTKNTARGTSKSQVWLIIYGRKRETIGHYGMTSR